MQNIIHPKLYLFLGLLSFQTVAAALPDALDATIHSAVTAQPILLSEKPASVAVGDWKSLNNQVHQRGGWQAYAAEAGGHNHDSMDHSKHQQMDHSKHQQMDHSKHQQMDHSKHQQMDHSKHQQMDHSKHQQMDHSKHQQMDHSKHQGKPSEQPEHHHATHH